MTGQIYKAYFEMQKRKSAYLETRSNLREKGDNETASEYGERASVVSECMSILIKECKLSFDQ